MACYKMNRLVRTLLRSLLIVTAAQSCLFAQNSPMMQMPKPRFGMCSARLGSKLYLIGGAKNAGQGLKNITQGIQGTTNMVSVFDFSTDTWDTVTPLDTPRVFATAVALGDSIYVMGGMDNNGNPLNSMEIYDPVSNSWHYGASMIKYRVGAASVVYGDSILVFGGAGSNSSLMSNVSSPLLPMHRLVEIYSPKTGSWVPSDSTYIGRVFHQAVRVGPFIYILGGIGGANLTPLPLSLIEKYVPGRGTIDHSFRLSDGRYFFAAVKHRDSIYVISGLGGGDQSYRNSFDPGVIVISLGSNGGESEPEARATLSSARASFIADVAPDSSIYLFGGLSPNYPWVADPTVASTRLFSSVTAVLTPVAVPQTFDLKQNYPNPFNPTTTIQFEVPAPGMNVNLVVFNLLGEKVATLANGYMTGGEHTAIFNGANYASGVYIYKLSNENGSIYRKMVLIK